MNDDELITVVRESFTGVHTTTAVEQIVGRSHRVRIRRRASVLVLAGALALTLALVAGTALTVTTLLPGGHHASPRPPLRLAAWTVIKQAGGTVRVTIRELLDPAGLQHELRADGVPASVTPLGRENPSCRPYLASPALMHRVFSHTFEYIPPPRQGPPATMPPLLGLVLVLLIHPPALPAGAGVQIAATFPVPSSAAAGGAVQEHGTTRISLVHASPGCTS
jgi:hypothetical protein